MTALHPEFVVNGIGEEKAALSRLPIDNTIAI